MDLNVFVPYVETDSAFIILLVLTLGLIGALIDSSIGMGYGLLTPFYILIGFDPLLIVPVLLFSQMIIGLLATIFHQKFKNVNIGKRTEDTKTTVLFTINGLIGILIAVIFAISLSSLFLILYIGIMIIVVGIIMSVNVVFKFSWKRLYILAGIGGFNKAISGGGYGPIMTAGQIITGRGIKRSVVITDFSEAILSGFSFLLYVIITGLQGVQLLFSLLMIITGLIGAPIGALITKKLDKTNVKKLIGFISISIGILTISKIFW